MTQTLKTNAPLIADAFYALSLESRIPNAEVLDDIVRCFPEHATKLTEFVICLVLDDLHDTVMESEIAIGETDDLGISPTVSRAMSRFQNRLHSVKNSFEVGAKQESLKSEGMTTINPFEELNRQEFRNLVTKLDVNAVFVAKLRDRQIDPEDMSDGFQEEVAEKLNVPIHVLVSHLLAPEVGVPTVQQYFKASDKPIAGKRQSFAEAVRSSGLSKRQQQRLMSL